MSTDQGGEHSELDYDALLGLLKLRRYHNESAYIGHSYRYKSMHQLRVLYGILKLTAYPNWQTRDTLGILLNLNPRSIQIWFQNMRQMREKTLGHDLESYKRTKSVTTSVIVDIFMRCWSGD
ncbi:hypothetical protein PAPHI01_0949 [Pancytospora philotis]|nr:hypothetical protein PAPHI01_0949 [Pancytospora philotis]